MCYNNNWVDGFEVGYELVYFLSNKEIEPIIKYCTLNHLMIYRHAEDDRIFYVGRYLEQMNDNETRLEFRKRTKKDLVAFRKKFKPSKYMRYNMAMKVDTNFEFNVVRKIEEELRRKD